MPATCFRTLHCKATKDWRFFADKNSRFPTIFISEQKRYTSFNSSSSVLSTPSTVTPLVTREKCDEDSTDYGAGLPAQRPTKSSYSLVYAVEPPHKKGSFRRFLFRTLNRREARSLIIGAGCGVLLSTGSMLAIPLVLARILDGAASGELLGNSPVLLLALFLFGFCGKVLREWSTGYSQASLHARLKCDLFRAIFSCQRGSSHPSFTAMLRRDAFDCESIASSLTTSAVGVFHSLFIGLGSALLLFTATSPALMAVTIGLALPLLCFAGGYGRFFRQLHANQLKSEAALRNTAGEHFRWVDEIANLRAEQQSLATYSRAVKAHQSVVSNAIVWQAVYSASTQFIVYGIAMSSMWAGALLVASERLTLGGLLAFGLYGGYGVYAVVNVTRAISELNRGYGSWIRVFDIVDRAADAEASAVNRSGVGITKKASNHVEKSVRAKMPAQYSTRVNNRLSKLDICFERISVTKGPRNILNEISFSLFPQCLPFNDTAERPRVRSQCLVTCVVAGTPTTLHTIAQLLLQRCTPDSGQVVYRDRNTGENLDASMALQQLAYTGPSPMLFSGTVAENIAFGNVSTEEYGLAIDPWRQSAIHTAGLRAGVEELIKEGILPQGYLTRVASTRPSDFDGLSSLPFPSATSLLPCQAQCVCLARALMRRPTVLLLNQVSDHILPAHSRQVVEDKVKRICQGCVEGTASGSAKSMYIVICTQQVPLIRLADHIVVLDSDNAGVVAISGTWEEVSHHEIFLKAVGWSESFSSSKILAS